MKIHNDEKLIIIAIAICVLASLFGFSFAYYTIAAPTSSGTGGKVEAQTSHLGAIVYDAGTSKINMEDAVPGQTASKNFTVEVKASGKAETVNYNIKLDITNNTFVKCDATNKGAIINGTPNECELDAQELVYTLKKGAQVLKTGDLAGITSGFVLATERVSPTSDTTYSYTFEIQYKNTGHDQNHNMNKVFEASLKVEG